MNLLSHVTGGIRRIRGEPVWPNAFWSNFEVKNKFHGIKHTYLYGNSRKIDTSLTLYAFIWSYILFWKNCIFSWGLSPQTPYAHGLLIFAPQNLYTSFKIYTLHSPAKEFRNSSFHTTTTCRQHTSENMDTLTPSPCMLTTQLQQRRSRSSQIRHVCHLLY